MTLSAPRPTTDCWRALLVVAIAVPHFALSMWLFFVSFGVGMARFDSGGHPSALERVLGAVVAVLHAPLTMALAAVLPARALPGWWGYVPPALNSLLWGVVLTLATGAVTYAPGRGPCAEPAGPFSATVPR